MSENREIRAIYAPGLGDEHSRGQDGAVAGWLKYGIDVAYHPVGWGDGEAFAPKLERLVAHIDELYEKSGKVALIGSSAGASGVLNAAGMRLEKVSSVTSICGKILNSDLTSPDFVKNPAFAGSIRALPESLEKLRAAHIPILSVNALWDGRVPTLDTFIEQATRTTLPMAGHVPTIAYAISLGKGRIIKFIKTQY